MAEQIITLGIGATPTNLTPFITTGLEIASITIIECSAIHILKLDTTTNIVKLDTTTDITELDTTVNIVC